MSPKEAISKGCTEDDCLVVPRAKVSPRKVESESLTSRGDGVKAGKPPKEAVSRGRIARDFSDVPRVKVSPK